MAKKSTTQPAKKKKKKSVKRVAGAKVRSTVEMKDAPEGQVGLVGNTQFKVQLERLRASDLLDQSDEVLRAKGQGCITNPNGPGC